MEVRIDHLPVILQHLSRRATHGIPHLIGFDRDAEIDLIARVGVGVEAERIPAPAILEREAARHDRLGKYGVGLVGTSGPDLRTDDAGDVPLDPYAIHAR